MPTTQSPELAPRYATHRENVAAPDVIADVDKKNGMNMATYESAHVQVVPEGGANPTVQVYWWSEAAEVWVPEHTPITRAGLGANLPYEFTVESKGRRLLVAVTAIAAGTVSVYVAGFRTTVQPVA